MERHGSQTKNLELMARAEMERGRKGKSYGYQRTIQQRGAGRKTTQNHTGNKSSNEEEKGERHEQTKRRTSRDRKRNKEKERNGVKE